MHIARMTICLVVKTPTKFAQNFNFVINKISEVTPEIISANLSLLLSSYIFVRPYLDFA
jgi:hypothetical protein